tara:strand:+ start:134 stop:616 length:483 start_codon:yes stop_codon:yes gene_type:complete
MKSLLKSLPLALGLALSVVTSAPAAGAAPAYVDALLAPYLELQTALAADDLPGAQGAARALLTAAQTDDAGNALKPSVEAIINAEKLPTARVNFLRTSNTLIALVRETDGAGQRHLYVAHCPMAFGGRGGDWLQKDEHIANPYYGSAMLTCGTTKPLSSP